MHNAITPLENGKSSFSGISQHDYGSGRRRFLGKE